jgi:hypothetical protein
MNPKATLKIDAIWSKHGMSLKDVTPPYEASNVDMDSIMPKEPTPHM